MRHQMNVDQSLLEQTMDQASTAPNAGLTRRVTRSVIMELKKQGKSLRAISSEVSTPVMPISFKTVQRLLQRHAEQY